MNIDSKFPTSTILNDNPDDDMTTLDFDTKSVLKTDFGLNGPCAILLVGLVLNGEVRPNTMHKNQKT